MPGSDGPRVSSEYLTLPYLLYERSCGENKFAFRPDWVRDGKAAPFKRNDHMLEIVPAGVVVFPGSGIPGNLADKAKKLGIPVLDHRDAK
jgi:hypothetical protein